MNRAKLLFLLSLANFIAIFVCIFFMPEKVVFRFDSDFLTSIFASKWIDLIVPSIQLISCIILLIIDIKTADIPHQYRYIVMYVAMSIAMLYTWIMAVIQFGCYQVGEKVALPISTIILMVVGLFMIAYTYYQKNKNMENSSIFSFKWVKERKIVWVKTHSFASFLGAICGLLIIACGIVNDIVFKSNWVYLIALGIYFVVYYIFTILHSARIYRLYK